MTDSYERIKSAKLKKEIKWYTYVDSCLNSKLLDFMDEYEIKNQAKVIRNFVNYTIDYFTAIFKKLYYEPQSYNEIELDDLIKKAIDAYEIGNGFQEEIKQRIEIPIKIEGAS